MASSIARFRGRTALLIGTAVLVVVAISVAVMARGPQFTPVSANPSVRIETNDLRPGDVRFFTYRDRAGDQIRFLLARDSTGQIKPPSTPANAATCFIRVTSVLAEVSSADFAATDTSWKQWNPGSHHASLRNFRST
jgi:hypothetical protein